MDIIWFNINKSFYKNKKEEEFVMTMLATVASALCLIYLAYGILGSIWNIIAIFFELAK